MRIIDDVKLDFKDVLFVPKRSTLKSRKEVELTKTYKFKNRRDRKRDKRIKSRFNSCSCLWKNYT